LRKYRVSLMVKRMNLALFPRPPNARSGRRLVSNRPISRLVLESRRSGVPADT